MNVNLSVENCDNLVKAVVQSGFDDYVDARVKLELNKKKMEPHYRMIEETKLFFEGELVQKMYPTKTVDDIINILEERVSEELKRIEQETKDKKELQRQK